MESTLVCPSCAEPLAGPAAACLACGLSLTGPAAARLWQVDQQLFALRDERSRLLTELSGQSVRAVRDSRLPPGAADGPPLAGRPDAWLPPSDPVRPARATWTGQQLLLATGVLLLVVAAAVFLAVAWHVLGVGGQVVVMVLATFLAAAASLRTSRHGLRQTAEALAVLTAGLLAVELTQARSLGFAALDRVGSESYAAGASASAALVLAAAASRDTRVSAFRLTCTGAAAVAVLAAAEAAELSVGGHAVAYLLASAAFGAVAHRVGVARRPAAAAAGGFLAPGVATAITGTLVEGSDTARLGCSATLLVTAAVAGTAHERVAQLGSAARTVLVGTVAVCVPAGVVSAAEQGGRLTLCVVGVALAAAAAAATSPPSAASLRRDLGQPGAVLAHVTAVVAVAVLLAGGDMAPAAVVLGALALSAAVTAWSDAATRAEVGGYAAVAGAGAVGLGASEVSTVAVSATTAVSGALTAYAVLLAALAAWRLRRPEELTLGAVSVGAAVAAAAAAPGHAVLLSVVLAVSGLTLFAYAVLPGRGALAVPAVVSCSAASWVLSHDAAVDVVEAYSLPLAALSLLAGLARLRREPDAPSWTTVGPACSAALLPSAWVSMADAELTRPLLTLAAAVVVLLVGVRLRWNSPVVTGAVAAGVVALSQLAPYALGLPRWLSLGVAGALLLGVGASYERRRVQVQSAARWVGALR